MPRYSRNQNTSRQWLAPVTIPATLLVGLGIATVELVPILLYLYLEHRYGTTVTEHYILIPDLDPEPICVS